MESGYGRHTEDHHHQEESDPITPTYEFSVSYQDTQPDPQQAPPSTRSIPPYYNTQKPQDSDSDSDSDSDKKTKSRPQARPNQGYAARPPTNFPPQNIPQQFPPQAIPQQFPPQAQNYQTPPAQPQNFPPQPSPQQNYTKPPPNTPYNQNGGVPMYQQNTVPVYQQGGATMYQSPAQGYVPQQSPYAPQAYPTNTGTVGWSTGLFDCMDDPTNAVITACFPCFTFGQIAEIIDNGHTTCATSGILYGCIAVFIAVPCLISCGYRSKLRSKYDLIEVPAADWITHCFCEWCALCQEYRELKNRGLDPEIGWQANMMKIQQQQGAMMMPPGQHMMK